jgi:hypothetical protein
MIIPRIFSHNRIFLRFFSTYSITRRGAAKLRCKWGAQRLVLCVNEAKKTGVRAQLMGASKD